VLFGIASSNALPALLFSNVAAMTLIGFNAHQVTDGLSIRGAKQRTAASAYTLMDPQTLSNAICKISVTALADLFNLMSNAAIRCAAAAQMQLRTIPKLQQSRSGTGATGAGRSACGTESSR